jgi:hypothetical protein
MVIGGCNKLCPTATWLSLVALLFLSVSIEDRLLYWTLVKSLIIRDTYTCLWERKGSLLSCRGFQLFLDQLIGGWERWRFKHRTKTGSQMWSLGVQVWTGTWTPRREWNGLVLFVPGVQARRVFFEVTSWTTLIRESPFLHDGTTWLWSSTIVRTESWKIEK